MSEDLDGAAKNWAKFQKEWAKLTAEMRPHWARFCEHPFDGHSYVNLFVESRRISAYLLGHIDAVLYPLLVSLIIYLSIH